MTELTVELYGTLVGTLRGDWRTFDFHTADQALETFGLDSQILSLAVPLTAIPARSTKARRQNFFAELLPEGRMLTRLADQAGILAIDVIGMLRRYGRDVAGAVQVWDPEEPGEPRTPRAEPIDTEGIGRLLRREIEQPLGNRPIGGKTSLAGVQEKVVLARTAQGWGQVIDGYPSTHLLKPQVPANPTGIFDEEYGARIARRIGLSSYETWIESIDGVHTLVIERYDRDANAPGGRIHQEDFNQILGAARDQKYQRHGGQVTLQRMAGALRPTIPDAIDQLLALVTLAVAVGNLDLHAKNVAVLHPRHGPAALAPAYDVVPLAHQDTDGELAMAVAGEYRHRALTRDHLVTEAFGWGVRDPGTIIDSVLESILDAVRSEVPLPGAYTDLRTEVEQMTINLLTAREIGA